MLYRQINQFLDYCSLADFSIRSIQTLTARLNEFEIFLKTQSGKDKGHILNNKY